MSVSFYVDGSEQLNVANGNFARLTELLGVEMDWGGEMAGPELAKFREKIAFVLESIQALPELDGGKPDEEDVGARGCRIVYCGLRPGYFTERLTQLRRAVDAAIARGLPLCWG